MSAPRSYRGNQYGEQSKTVRGEIVKSRAEKQIADYLNENNIKYVYEDQAKTTQSAFRTRISKPDFFLPDYGVHVEYWGLIDVGDWQDRNKYREDKEWKTEQYRKNGIKLISLYPWNLDDLDGAFRAEFRKVLGRDLAKGPVGEKSVYALPILPGLRRTIKNGISSQMELSGVDLEYMPYFFVEYDCFTEGNFLYQRVNFSSKGVLVIEGQKGQVVDVEVESGVLPTLPRRGYFADCRNIEAVETPRSKIAEGTSFDKFGAVPVKVSQYEAEKIARIEIARNFSQEFTRTLKNGTVRSMTLRPSISHVRIVSVKQANVPLVTATFSYKGRTYRRKLQAATNHMVADDFIYCNVEGQHLSEGGAQLCMECGGLGCEDHSDVCVTCGKSFCVEHIVTKGLILKKTYCVEHAQS